MKTSRKIHTLATVQQSSPAETVRPVGRHLWTHVDRLRDMSYLNFFVRRRFVP